MNVSRKAAVLGLATLVVLLLGLSCTAQTHRPTEDEAQSLLEEQLSTGPNIGGEYRILRTAHLDVGEFLAFLVWNTSYMHAPQRHFLVSSNRVVGHNPNAFLELLNYVDAGTGPVDPGVAPVVFMEWWVGADGTVCDDEGYPCRCEDATVPRARRGDGWLEYTFWFNGVELDCEQWVIRVYEEGRVEVLQGEVPEVVIPVFDDE